MASTAVQQHEHFGRNDILVNVRLDQLIAALLVWANVFVCGAYFRGQVEVEDFTVHWQILLRLGIALTSGVAGLFWLFPHTYRQFISGAGLLLTLSCLWYGVTLPFAVNTGFSFASWASLVGVFFLVPAAMRILGGVTMMKTIGFSLMCYIVGSWIAYLFVPSVGVYREWITEDIQYVRMGGLGHPNSLGIYSAFAVLVFSGLIVSKQMRRGVALACIVLAAFTLFYCFSRISMIACIFGLMFTLQNQIRTRTAVVLAMAALCIVGLLSFVVIGSGSADWLIEDTLIKFTKSGSTTELTTATGRTEIWAYGLGQILESPIIGYGYCSGRFVMEFNSFHCHNIVLNAALFGDIPSALLLISILLHLMWSMFTRPNTAIDGLAACIIFGGMFDELIVAASPSASVVIWIVLVFWRQMGMSMDISTEFVESPSNVR